MKSVRVWDNFTRLYHFSQLILLATLWYSAEQADFETHFTCGFIMIALWLTRLFWGVIGSTTSKFKHFIKSPVQVINAWRNNSIGKPHIGHNPVGGYMVIFLLFCLGLQLFSGLFASDDVLAEGPFYYAFSDNVVEYMDSIHSSNFDILLILVAIHALAGILHVLRGDNVIKTIFTGKKDNIEPNSPVNLKSAVLPIVIWAILAIGIYQWGMSQASF